MFLERVGIHKALDALAGAEVEMVVALRTDLQVFGEGKIVDHLAAGRALGPETGRHLTGLVAECAEDGFFKNSHSVCFLTTRQSEGANGLCSLLQEDGRTGIEGRAGCQDIVDKEQVLICHRRILAQ